MGVDTFGGKAQGGGFRRLSAGGVAVEGDGDGFGRVLLEERQVIGGQAVGAVAGNRVVDSGADQGEAVDDRFGEDDFLVGLGGLPVEEATPWAGKVEVRRAFAVVHLLDAPAIDAGGVAGQIVQREGGAAVEVLAAPLVEDAEFLQPVDDVAFLGQDVEQCSVGKADAMGGKQGVVGNAPADQVFPGSAVFAEGLVVELDHAGKEFDLFGGECCGLFGSGWRCRLCGS